MVSGVVDCHAHIFPPAAGASGFSDVESHRIHQQRAMHMHGNQPYRRHRDNAIVTDRMLWDAEDSSPAGAKDVSFSAGRFGFLGQTSDFRHPQSPSRRAARRRPAARDRQMATDS